MIDHNGLSEDQFLSMFKVYIEYTRHENELIHHRTTWLVTTQGGFILILAFLIQKYFEVVINLLKIVPNPENASQLVINSDQRATLSLFIVFWIIICIVGFATSLSARRSIDAAIRAQTSIREKWDRLFLARADLVGLPHLMGGGSEIADKNGAHFARRLPQILLTVWIIFLILAVLLAGYGLEISIKLTKFFGGS